VKRHRRTYALDRFPSYGFEAILALSGEAASYCSVNRQRRFSFAISPVHAIERDETVKLRNVQHVVPGPLPPRHCDESR
jgi:hypothetical protein